LARKCYKHAVNKNPTNKLLLFVDYVHKSCHVL